MFGFEFAVETEEGDETMSIEFRDKGIWPTETRRLLFGRLERFFLRFVGREMEMFVRGGRLRVGLEEIGSRMVRAKEMHLHLLGLIFRFQ